MNSSKLIDMSLDDIIKLTKLEKRRQFRNKTPIIQKAKLNAKFRQFRSPLNKGFLNKSQKWQGRKNVHEELYRNPKKINLQQASERLQQIKRIWFQKQQKQRNVAKIILQNQLQNLRKNTQSKINHQYLGRNMLPFSTRKHIRKNLSIQKRNFLSEDVLTISINNNLPRRPLQKEKLFRPKIPFDLPTSQMQITIPSPKVSKPTGVRDLRPLVNQTTKTLNDRFTNHKGMRVVFS